MTVWMSWGASVASTNIVLEFVGRHSAGTWSPEDKFHSWYLPVKHSCMALGFLESSLLGGVAETVQAIARIPKKVIPANNVSFRQFKQSFRTAPSIYAISRDTEHRYSMPSVIGKKHMRTRKE